MPIVREVKQKAICGKCGSGQTYMKAKGTILVCRTCGVEEVVRQEYECGVCETKWIDIKNYKEGRSPICPKCGEPVDSDIIKCKCGELLDMLSLDMVKTHKCPYCGFDYGEEIVEVK